MTFRGDGRESPMLRSIIWVRHFDQRLYPSIHSVTNKTPGANCLLAYFHYCSKNVFPFSPQCKDEELKSLADLDSTAMNFVRYAREVAAQNRK